MDYRNSEGETFKHYASFTIDIERALQTSFQSNVDKRM